ncbi:hypothetical protein C8Q72DRAFT_782692 [Fomitopsis betulina]|nr:hypothetical protein C8Q72DRAFT_782692 [Fomitopsis betulina]
MRRYDCVFVGTDPLQESMCGLHVACFHLLFSFRHDKTTYPCTLVEWFEVADNEPDDCTGMWIVEQEVNGNGSPNMFVIHLDYIVHLVHLIPVYGKDPLPPNLDPVFALDVFIMYFVNKYADHNAHKITF